MYMYPEIYSSCILILNCSKCKPNCLPTVLHVHVTLIVVELAVEFVLKEKVMKGAVVLLTLLCPCWRIFKLPSQAEIS